MSDLDPKQVGREAAAKIYEAIGAIETAADIRSEQHDDWKPVKDAIAGATEMLARLSPAPDGVWVSREVLEILTAISEGYAAEGADDRFVIVENPKATEEAIALRGESPNLVLDVWTLTPGGREAIKQEELERALAALAREG